MGVQFSIVTKAEAHNYIDQIPGKKVMILTYDGSSGFSDEARVIRKKKGKKMVDEASTIVLFQDQINILNLYPYLFSDPLTLKDDVSYKTILLPNINKKIHKNNV